MNCYNGIEFPRQELFFQSIMERKEISYPHRNLKIILSVSNFDLCFLEINLEQNYLIHQPDRFVIWNKTCQLEELPIWNRFVLLKEYQYEIYDRRDKILDWNGNYLSIYE